MRKKTHLLIFGNTVAQKSKSVITDSIGSNWKFYTYTTSIRTNLALRTQSILKGLADSIDTSGDSALNAAIKAAIKSIFRWSWLYG